jgi:hypothetical protein
MNKRRKRKYDLNENLERQKESKGTKKVEERQREMI